jgi:hypothetical protein
VPHVAAAGSAAGADEAEGGGLRADRRRGVQDPVGVWWGWGRAWTIPPFWCVATTSLIINKVSIPRATSQR